VILFAALERIREARFFDLIQGKMRNRALLTTRWRFFFLVCVSQPMYPSWGAHVQAAAENPIRARI
jgi:hypothetical protein